MRHLTATSWANLSFLWRECEGAGQTRACQFKLYSFIQGINRNKIPIYLHFQFLDAMILETI